MSTVIFDMDGVLVDSGELTVTIIGKSWNGIRIARLRRESGKPLA